ncbi:MAG: FGGY family carbohydrate kinase, partial [Candidatus Bathyarchaeia archaeon]
MVASLLLGTDVGTFGTKSCIIDVTGEVLSDSFVETDILIPKPGWAEQWPDVWWRAYLESVRKTLEKANVDPKDVRGVSVSGLYTGSGIPVDSEFKPLRPGIIWMDRRANE